MPTMTERLATAVLVLLSIAIPAAAIVHVGIAPPAYADAAASAAALADAGAAPEIAAPAAPDPGTDPAGWAGALYDAIRGGRWAMVAGLVLMGVTYAARRWLLASWRWAQTGVGGLVTVAGLGVIGLFANAGLAGRWPDGHAWAAAAEAVATAIAAYVAARKVAGAPSSKAPAAEGAP